MFRRFNLYHSRDINGLGVVKRVDGAIDRPLPTSVASDEWEGGELLIWFISGVKRRTRTSVIS